MTRRWAIGSVVLGWLVMIGLLWPHRGLVPFWDGWVYARCVLDEPGIITRCAWHPALAWTIPMLLAKLGSVPGATPLFAPQLVLGLVALVGWSRLVAAVMPASEDRVIRAMLVLGVAIHPATLAAVLQPNIDLAVLAWGLWTLGALVRRELAAMVLFGTLLCFSKETGVLLYGIAAAVWWSTLWRTPAVLRHTLAFSIPLLVYAAVVFGPAVLAAGHSPTIWGVSNGSPGFLRDFRPWDLWSKQLLNQAFLVTVLQFQWVPALGIAVGATLALRRGHWRWRDFAPTTGWRMLAWTLLSGFYVITSYRTYSNLRYFTIFVPFLALGAAVILAHAGVSRRWRTLALACWIPALLLSVRWSADPVTRAIVGTFSLGDEQMFRVTRISGECCGYGHDALAYNLQYTALGRVLDRAMSELRPGDSTIVVKTRWLGWAWLTALDPVTQRRTLDERHGVLPPMIEAESLTVDASRPRRVWFVLAPHVPIGPESLAPLYTPFERRTVRAGGAALELIELRRAP